MPFKKGNPGCPCCKCKNDPKICVAPLSTCSGNPPIIGATVTLKRGGSDIATCTTTRQIKSLTLFNAGSGYTDGTDFALGITGGGGSGASALFDVVGGQVTNLRLIDGGHDFDGTTVTLDFSASAGGSGASATYILAVQCCFTGVANGSYTVTVDADGFPTYTSPTVRVPPCTVNVGPIMTPNKARVRVYVGACNIIEGAAVQYPGVGVVATQGGVTVDSGVTDSTGHVILYVPPFITTVFTATETATGRFDPRVVTQTGGYSNTCTLNTLSMGGLVPASAYRCLNNGCPVPAPKSSLNLSTPADGGFTLTYDATYGLWWGTDGTITYSFNGSSLFRNAGTTPSLTIACSLNLFGGVIDPHSTASVVSCPPSYLATFVADSTGPYRGASGGGGSCIFQGFNSAPHGGTITISE